MIRPDQIPDEVIEAAARALAALEDNETVWDTYINAAEATIAAALNAWPDAHTIEDDDYCAMYEGDIVLPRRDA